MLEYHPFGSFLPHHVKYLVVGTFPGKQYSQLPKEVVLNDPMAWSYAGRNQFWTILAEIYECELVTKAQKQALSTELQLGFCDLIKAAHRKDNNNQDNNLTDIVWNKPEFEAIFEKNQIETVYCTGVAVAKMFTAWFPTRKDSIVALPSPSPLYAAMKYAEKVEKYRLLLPRYN